MLVLQVILVVVCLLMLWAHFLRAGAILLAAFCVAMMALLFVRRPWAGRVLQVVLVFGMAVWLLTLVSTATDRIAQGDPWLRLVAILGMVAGVTGLTARTLQRGALGRHFGLLPATTMPSEPRADIAG